MLNELRELIQLEQNAEVMDGIYSIGERLSSRYFFEYLKKNLGVKVQYLDARKILMTDHQFGRSRPLFAEIQARSSDLNLGELIVTQGFIGATLEGKTTTLGREGSDYSAAIFAEALRAKEIHIWTDSPGICDCRP